MTPLNVLISSGIWPPEVGGPASHGPEIGRFLVDRGHTVRAVTTSGPDGPEFPGFPISASRKDRHQLIRQPAAAARVLSSTRGADVVYATGLYGRSSVASKALGVPLVVKLVSDPAYERARRLGLFSGSLEEFQRPSATKRERFLKAARRAVLSRARTIVIPSQYLARIAAGWGLPGARMQVVPNPAPDIDEQISRETLRERLGIRGPTFVFAGRLTAQKNLPLAVAALGGVSGARLVVIGSGSSDVELQEAIAEHGVADRVAITGALPRSQVIDWLRAADASVLPSDWENFPHAAVEALAAGTPVVATAVGGVPEIVESGVNGILTPRGDRDALQRALTALVSDDQLRSRLAAGAKAAKERYRKEDIYGQIERELELAASSARRTRPYSSWAASR